jgi:protein required for attachment to host cells
MLGVNIAAERNMLKSRIWVLITDGSCARLCSTGDGTVTPITPLGDFEGPMDHAAGRSHIWYGSKSGYGFLPVTKARFAAYVAQLLQEGAAEQSYDGLIIVATPQIAAELEQSLDPKTRALLIGGIVRDLPQLEPAKPPACVSIWH